MQKIKTTVLLYLIVNSISIGLALGDSVAGPISRDELSVKFPYGFVGDFSEMDGILTEEDFTINRCDRVPEKIGTSLSPYEYWTCFDANNAALKCEIGGYDSSEQSQMAFMVIQSKKNGTTNEYLSRRPSHLENCRWFQHQWKNLVSGQKRVCVSGEFIDDKPDDAGRPTTSWVFGRFKTRKGCQSYFHGGCNLAYVTKNHGCQFLEPKASISQKR